MEKNSGKGGVEIQRKDMALDRFWGLTARLLGGTEMLRRTGRPEREIVQTSLEWRADVVIICSRTDYEGVPHMGPKSVGHVARFVLDHAPCPVLLVRPLQYS